MLYLGPPRRAIAGGQCPGLFRVAGRFLWYILIIGEKGEGGKWEEARWAEGSSASARSSALALRHVEGSVAARHREGGLPSERRPDGVRRP